MRKHKRTLIKEDLLQQLGDRGITGQHYLNLIEDYLDFFDIKKSLIQDIKDRGVTVQYDNGGGQTGYKKNDSLGELTKVNSQMLKILNDLGLKGADIDAGTTDGMGADHDEDDEM